jgi:hypothetical protein
MSSRQSLSTCGHASTRYLDTWRTESKSWCRGPGTHGSRHPLRHQDRGINPSCAMRCTLALYKPSPKQHGRPTFVEPARTEASSTDCHTFRPLSVTLALTGKCARFMVFSCGRTTNPGRRTGYTADHPCIPKPHKMETWSNFWDLRLKQGYTVAMAVEESRLLQVTIFRRCTKTQTIWNLARCFPTW